MLPNFKQTHDVRPLSTLPSFSICTNIQLWWQWSWCVLKGTPVCSWISNTKAGHSGCTGWLERESWRWTRRLGRSLWTFLQSRDQGQRAQASRLRNLQQFVLANTLGNHKPSRRWTWHSPDGTHHNQIDYILVKKRFCSGIKTARTRTFPGADVGSMDVVDLHLLLRW